MTQKCRKSATTEESVAIQWQNDRGDSVVIRRYARCSSELAESHLYKKPSTAALRGAAISSLKEDYYSYDSLYIVLLCTPLIQSQLWTGVQPARYHSLVV